jgi:DMSO/TMAO reductase YedYZ molybdopterin-dependent catalytic subunit
MTLKSRPKISPALILIMFISFFIFISCKDDKAGKTSLSIKGAVKDQQVFSISDLKKMPSFFLKDHYLIKEKATGHESGEELLSLASYRGVLLRDLLLETGMKYKRKWEPGVLVKVRDINNKEIVFSFGEIFYSSIGRSILVAWEKNGKPIEFKTGAGELVISTDLRAGRKLDEIKEIVVERVEVELKAYDDKKNKVVRPPSTSFTITDHKSNSSRAISLDDLKSLQQVSISSALMAGDCEGFGGIFSFKGTTLRSLLGCFGIKEYPVDYDRYVLVSSEDGFCATFSMGEIYNSRLSDNIVIAYEKDGKALDSKDAFAMSAVREDSTGGRSVKRIQKIEIF